MCNRGLRGSRDARIRGVATKLVMTKMEVGAVLDAVVLLSMSIVVMKK